MEQIQSFEDKLAVARRAIAAICADENEVARAYELDELYESWKKDGYERDVLDLLVEFVARAKNWREVAEHLNAGGRYDEAITVARAGIQDSLYGGDYSNDYAQEMMEPLADAFAGKGNHLMAAAVRAEQFLSWLGAYEFHRTIESFNRILEEADKAGVREEIRTAILYALKTGVNPVSLWDWKFSPPVPECAWLRPAKVVGYRAPDASGEVPAWPLPRSNEGLKFPDLRWGTMLWFCQQDQEFLLKVALAEGDQAEIVRRFEALPEFPHRNGWILEDDRQAMLEAVAVAVGEIRPDIAEKIRLRPGRRRVSAER